MESAALAAARRYISKLTLNNTMGHYDKQQKHFNFQTNNGKQTYLVLT